MIKSLIDNRVTYTGLGIASYRYIYEGFPISFLCVFNLLFKLVYIDLILVIE